MKSGRGVSEEKRAEGASGQDKGRRAMKKRATAGEIISKIREEAKR